MNFPFMQKIGLKINLETRDVARTKINTAHTHTYIYSHIWMHIYHMHYHKYAFWPNFVQKNKEAACSAFFLCSSQFRWLKVCFSLNFLMEVHYSARNKPNFSTVIYTTS